MARNGKRVVNRRKPNRRGAAQIRRVGVRRATAPPQAQGVGKYPSVPYGSNGVTHNAVLGLDATSSMHLPLPRPIAPYTTTRITTTFTTNDEYVILGTFANHFGIEDTWSTAVAMLRGSSAGATAMNGDWGLKVLDQNVSVAGLTMVPSAFTVQVINPEALQTTSGTIFMARSGQQLKYYRNSVLTTQELFENLKTVNPPRLCSAGKLALRGVVANALPFSMSQLSEFRNATFPNTSAGGVIQWNDTGTNPWAGSPSGFSPIYVHNPNEVGLSYIVTVECRVRFNPGNIAAAGHRAYPSAPLKVWENVVQGASSTFHGVQDIAEAVASAGAAVREGAAAWRAIGTAAKVAMV